MTTSTVKIPRMKQPRKVMVSLSNLKRSAARVLPSGQTLVSTEMFYVQRTLGGSATEQQIDDSVAAVRKMPWASIVTGDE